MLRKVRPVMLAHLTLLLFAMRSGAQEPDGVPEAELRVKETVILQWAELHFIDDERFLELRHFSRKYEPIVTAHGIPKKSLPMFGSGREPFAPLVGTNLFGKTELDSELFGKGGRPFRSEGIRLACSPDGRVFLTSSFHTVRLWDAAKGTPIGPGREHSGNVLAAFTKSGKRIVTVAAVPIKGKVRFDVQVWDGSTMEPIGDPTVATTPGIVQPYPLMKALLWTPDEKSFITAYGGTKSMSKSVQFWDAETRKPVGDPLPAEGDFHQFSPDGKTLLVVSKNELALWDVSERKIISRLPTPEIAKQWNLWAQEKAAKIRRWFAVHPNGTSVLYANQGRAELWDLGAETPRKKQVLEHSSAWVEISRDGKRAATAGLTGVFVWNLETGRPTLKIPRERQDGPIKAMRFSPDGQLLAIANDRDVRIWSVESKK